MTYPELLIEPHFYKQGNSIRTTRLRHDYNTVFVSRKTYRRWCSALSLHGGDYLDIVCLGDDGFVYHLCPYVDNK